MTARDIELRTPLLRMAAREWGGGSGRPVLALHGWLDNAASFDRLAPLLEGLQLVALDFPGHGRSDHWPVGHIHHFVDWVPAVLAAADALGWQRFSLVGHSMGAGVAALVPGVAPERVERIALLEGFGPMTSPAEQTPEQLARALRSESELANASARVFPDLAAAVAARRRNSDIDSESARMLVERSIEPCAGGVRFTYDPRVKTRSRLRLTEEQVLAFLRAIRCPVLAVRASGGWPYPEQVLVERLAVVADVRTVQVEGGHHVHLTHPERVAPLIREFFDDAEGGAQS